jgi:hypothetical protein
VTCQVHQIGAPVKNAFTRRAFFLVELKVEGAAVT